MTKPHLDISTAESGTEPGGAEVVSSAFENLPLGALVFDAQGRILRVNKAFARITGYRLVAEPSGGFGFQGGGPEPEGQDAGSATVVFQERLHRALRGQDPTVVIVRADGHPRQVALQYADLGEGRWVVTLTDVSEEAVASRTLGALYGIANAISVTRDLSELYAAIHAILHTHVDATNFFIGMVDEEQDCIVFPYFSDEVDEYYDIANISDPATDTLTVRVIRSGKPLFLRHDELISRKSRGEISLVGTDPAVWLGVPLSVGGKVIGAMAVQHYENPLHYDETDVAFMVAISEQVAVAIERKKAEEALSRLNERLEAMVAERTAALEQQTQELTRANERLQELDRIKSALLSSVSHELRTPLTSILGFAKLIRKDFRKHFQKHDLTPEEAQRGERIVDNLRIVSRESERLTRLISEFLDLARIESGHMVWNDQHLDPEQALLETAQAASGLFENSPLTLRLQAAAPLPGIVMDPDKLRQVLLNLLHNAVKFTIEGEVLLAVAAKDGSVVFSVRDTGLGIPPHALERIFDKFFKVEEDVRWSTSGAGLGLAICRQIVDHYGGRVEVESTPGQGSCFSVTLPAQTSA